MESILLVSSNPKSNDILKDILMQNNYKEIVTVSDSSEASRLLLERDFDLVIINTPLTDDFGVKLAKNIAAKAVCQIILLIKAELYDEITASVEELGILTVAKPINKIIFWNTLKLANAAYNKMNLLKNENKNLLQKLEDIQLISRAKCILIQYLGMTEAEAHRYIEKQAMDSRKTKRSISEDILKTYEG